MGQSFLKGLIASPDNHQIVVVEHNPDNARLCEDAGGLVVPKLENLDKEYRSSDVAILAVKPKDITSIGTEIAGFLDTTCVIVSIAAGISIATLSETLS